LTQRAFSTSPLESGVRLLEVGPRDGLQNIKTQVPTEVKVELIKRLAATGLTNIEATSFVSPKWVPQLADGATVMEQVLPLAREKPLNLPVLAPNLKGFQNALKSSAKEVVVFASCTEAFSKMNQNCTIEEALAQAKGVIEAATERGVRVRGVVSCIFSDPYSGPTHPSQVLPVVKRLLDMGCYEVGLGDTLGVGTPQLTQNLLDVLLKEIPANKLAGHFHDTYGQGVANVVAAYSMGIRAFDSAVAGLGGCPYAKGAQGNVATEDVVYTLETSGISTGVDLDKLISVGGWISEQVGIPNRSRAGSALLARRKSVTTAESAEAEFAKQRAASSTETGDGSKKTQSSRYWQITEQTPEFTVSRAENVVKVTLTRPAKGNNMTIPMLEQLTNLFTTMAKDRSIFSIVLAAEGKFFCTGMDLSTGTDRTGSSTGSTFYEKVAGLFAAIEKAPQTTIAMIHGPCYAGGAGLGFVFDIRLASAQARWTLSEIKLGLVPAIISRYLAREWGFSFLREAVLTGREIHVDELHRIGAVHGVADDSEGLEKLLDETLDRLSYCAPQAAATCKQLLHLAWADAGGQRQDDLIEKTFERMMLPGSEGEFGIQQFQKNIRKVQWSDFWARRSAAM
jgi:hydroxymethylglutaryl-CoA lyase